MSLLSLLPYILLFLALIIASAFVAFILYLHHVRAKYRHLPSPPLDSWLMGHLPTINKKHKEGVVFNAMLHEWSLEHGDVFVLWFIHQHLVVAVGPELVKKVLITLNLPKSQLTYCGLQYVFNTRVLGYGLVSECNTQSWLHKRMALNPAFHRKYLMKFIDEFNLCCDKLIKKLEGYANTNVAVDLAEEFHRVTMDIIGTVGFNKDWKAVEDKNCPFLKSSDLVMKGIEDMFQDMFWRINIKRYPFQWKVIKAAKFVRESGRKIIEERIAAIKDGKTAPSDILQHIIEMKANNPSVTMDEMVDEFVTFFLAGQETTSNLLSYTLYEIEKHADIKQRVVEEVESVLGNKNVSYDDLPKLQYLERTLKEALRLHPPAHSFSRSNHNEIELAGYKIPAGSSIEISILTAHRSESNWINPELFDPERFASHNSIPVETYFPFSMGPRSCIGKNFAQFESKIIMARLYQEFEFELVSGKPMRYEEALTVRPKDGVWCRVKRRR